MKIALFYPTQGCPWSLRDGIRNTLVRMGHTITDDPVPSDVVFVSGPEYLMTRLRIRFPLWDLMKMPKIGWLHETLHREDYTTNFIAENGMLPLGKLKLFTPLLFTQASQDQAYGLRWVPCGVDTEMFFPRKFYPEETTKNDGIIYTGALYNKRRDFLKANPGIKHQAAYREPKSDLDYAAAISRATAVLNLPSLSAMSTAKVFEVLASKTALITPIMDGPENYALFEHGKHLLYYTDDPIPELDILQASLGPDNLELAFMKTRGYRPLSTLKPLITPSGLAQAGYDEVLKNHTLEQRLRTMLEGI